MISEAQRRRHPVDGWIKPKKDDDIINDARMGFDILQIARRVEVTTGRVIRVLKAAYQNEILSSEEADALNLLGAKDVDE